MNFDRAITLLFTIMIFIFVSCSSGNNRYSVLDNNLNYITIVNTTSDTLNLNISQIDKFLISGSDRFDNVNPYDTVYFKTRIGLPKIIQVLLKYSERSFYMFPGKNRVLEYTNLGINEVGEHSEFYQILDQFYLAGTFIGNSIWGTQVEHINFLDSYKASKLEFLKNNKEYLSNKQKSFIEDEIQFQYLNYAYSQADAHYSFYDTIIVMPDSIIEMANYALQEDFKYDRPYYRSLIEAMGRYEIFDNYNFEIPPSNIQNKYRDNIIHFIDKRLSPNNQQEILLNYVLSQKLREKNFSEHNESSIVNILKEKYNVYYRSQDSLITHYYNEGDFVTNIELLDNLKGLDQNIIDITLANYPKIKLIKLWFKGCSFCQKTIPIDKIIAKNQLDTEVIYIAYSTSFKDYEEYSKEHKLNESNIKSLYYGGTRQKLRETFGKLYAPKYSIVSADSVICSGCNHSKNDLLYYFE